MSNVIHPPQFDRPEVHQPHPRLRRGTLSFRKRRAAAIQAGERNDLERVRERCLQRALQSQEDARRVDQAHATVSKVMRHMVQEDARDADVLPLYIPNTGWRSYALVRALRQLGIGMEFDIKRQGIVLRAADERGPAA